AVGAGEGAPGRGVGGPQLRLARRTDQGDRHGIVLAGPQGALPVRWTGDCREWGCFASYPIAGMLSMLAVAPRTFGGGTTSSPPHPRSLAMTPTDELTFELYNLRVEISDRSGPIVGKHRVGEYFEVIGEDLFLPPGQGFSLYALAALLPLLPAKQRPAHVNDW